MIRKFTIHILAITAVTPDIFDLQQEQNAMIICTERTNKNIWSCKPEVWLKVMMNKREFRMVQKGRPCKYEWWEILE